MAIFFLSFEFIRVKLDANSKLDYIILIVLIIKFLWDIMADKNIKSIEFNSFQNKLTVIENNYFGKESKYKINYSDLNYEIENSNNFWKIFVGKKILTFLKNKMEMFKIGKSSGYTEKQIFEIESKLLEIKNACR
ncbi:hypothetical protein [Chryseobacterium koreense]|uniref:Uncharacterized protein n=1 Tax=Chryseobacterium koreense CCUG 49689 TaxID=1304281 RepID=A0A0J7IP99_9FLAO|nr:hypothetical protein [Chryseobacterium koreense]KMQ67998.1 hypothetical protein ACM44_14710 [Chryseobacterium koreense CCUG 49689]MBB5332628.1 hypothetical protein [Chryseobacterium koreense]